MAKIDSKTNKIVGLIIPVVLLWAFSPPDSAAADYKMIKTISAGKDIGSTITWQITASQEDTGKRNYPQVPAKICFSNTSKVVQCELAGGVEVINDLEVVRFRDNEEPSSGVLLMTNTYAIGGGPLYLSLWVYDQDKERFRNILPAEMHVPALGMYKFFPSLQKKGILIVAGSARLLDLDAALDDPDRETIWSPHYYIIDIYQYQPDRGFSKTRSFKTKKRYDPEGDAERLIDSELTRIKALLRN